MLPEADPCTAGGRARSYVLPAWPGLSQRRRGVRHSLLRAGQCSRGPCRPLLRRHPDHHAGTDSRVAALVYIAALAPDGTETSQSLQQKFPVTEVFSHIEVADGRIWLKQPGGIGCFAGDLPEAEQKLVWATQAAPVPDLFNQKVDGVAWQSKPSWYIVATEDRTVHPELQRFVAKRMGATTGKLRSSHVPMLSQPQSVLDVIRNAAKAIQKSKAA